MTDEELIERLRNAPADGLGTENLCLEGADRIEALVRERDKYRDAFNTNCLVLRGTEEHAERLEAAVLAAAKIGQIVGFLGEDEGRIEAFREACGPELWAKARTALKGDDHE